MTQQGFDPQSGQNNSQNQPTEQAPSTPTFGSPSPASQAPSAPAPSAPSATDPVTGPAFAPGKVEPQRANWVKKLSFIVLIVIGVVAGLRLLNFGLRMLAILTGNYDFSDVYTLNFTGVFAVFIGLFVFLGLIAVLGQIVLGVLIAIKGTGKARIGGIIIAAIPFVTLFVELITAFIVTILLSVVEGDTFLAYTASTGQLMFQNIYWLIGLVIFAAVSFLGQRMVAGWVKQNA